MFETCYTNNESCFSFDNAACETIRTARKGRRSLVSRDRRVCKGGDDSFAKNFVSTCGDVPALAEHFMHHHFHRVAQRAVWGLLGRVVRELTVRVALREAACNSMSKLAAAVKPAVVEPPVPVMIHCAPAWYAVCAADVVMIDAPAYTQCETGSLPPRAPEHDGWWRTACAYGTVYGPENQELRECSYHAEAHREHRDAAHPERIPVPAITTEELAAMPTAKVEGLVKLCNARLEALHEAPVYWHGATAWTELLTYANSELRYRAAC